MFIHVDRNLCIGAAPCVAVAGNVFQLDEEGKAVVIGPSTDDQNTRLAAEACPVRAIFLYADDHSQIYPNPQEAPLAFNIAFPDQTATTSPAQPPSDGPQPLA